MAEWGSSIKILLPNPYHKGDELNAGLPGVAHPHFCFGPVDGNEPSFPSADFPSVS
ncbi:MAG: hypothetical protein KDA84_17265 [Planctomycetaceae bacterium]|nr:hypothetical protein [Planctomycetaceae bacterium]